jgi:CheY-like chemotaxis protein
MSGSLGRVLVVDDDDSVRSCVEAFLLDEGFAVESAASGEQALASLTPGRVDVAVVDVRLPGMNGDELIRRAHRRDPALRFVVYTGSPEYSPPPSLAAAGLLPEHVLRKPLFDMRVLARAIDRLVAWREREPW